PSPSQFYNGDMDEFRIWDVARTQGEIQSNMNSELTGNEVNLLVYYNFNHGISGGNNTGITMVTDHTTNGHGGNLNGFTLNGATSNFILDDCEDIPTGIIDQSLFEMNTIYPNPHTGQFTVASNSETASMVEIFDLTGKRIETQNNVINHVLIDITRHPKGIYLVKITTGSEVIFHKVIYQ